MSKKVWEIFAISKLFVTLHPRLGHKQTQSKIETASLAQLARARDL